MKRTDSHSSAYATVNGRRVRAMRRMNRPASTGRTGGVRPCPSCARPISANKALCRACAEAQNAVTTDADTVPIKTQP